MKNIQKQLEADLNIPLADRKQFIRDEVREPPSLARTQRPPINPNPTPFKI